MRDVHESYSIDLELLLGFRSGKDEIGLKSPRHQFSRSSRLSFGNYFLLVVVLPVIPRPGVIFVQGKPKLSIYHGLETLIQSVRSPGAFAVVVGGDVGIVGGGAVAVVVAVVRG